MDTLHPSPSPPSPQPYINNSNDNNNDNNEDTSMTISCYQLQHLLHTDPLNVLILDCRTSVDQFNKSHILTSVHCGAPLLQYLSSSLSLSSEPAQLAEPSSFEIEPDKSFVQKFETFALRSYADKIFFRQREFVKYIVLYTSLDPFSNANHNHKHDNDENNLNRENDKTENHMNDKNGKPDNEEIDCLHYMMRALMKSQESGAIIDKIRVLQDGFLHFQAHCPLYCEYNSHLSPRTLVGDGVNSLEMMSSYHAQNSHHHHHNRYNQPFVNISVNSNNQNINNNNNNNNNLYVNEQTVENARDDTTPPLSPTSPTSSMVHGLTVQQRLEQCHKRLFHSLRNKLSCDAPSQLLPFLYLGNAQNSINLQQMHQLKISCIVNMAPTDGVQNFFPHLFRYLSCELLDDESADVSAHFEETYQFIERARKSRQRILITCFMGMSRSASISIAYLMRAKQWSMKRAYAHVKKSRPIIDINTSFMCQLIQFEFSLFGKSSLPAVLFRQLTTTRTNATTVATDSTRAALSGSSDHNQAQNNQIDNDNERKEETLVDDRPLLLCNSPTSTLREEINQSTCAVGKHKDVHHHHHHAIQEREKQDMYR